MRFFLYFALLPLVFAMAACGPVQFDTSTVATASGGPVVGLRDVHYNSVVGAADNKVDIVLIIDDSNSMLQDNRKLAAKLSDFVSDLQSSSIDWQMCVTVTRPLMVTGSAVWGSSVFWQNYTPPIGTNGWVLKPSSSLNLSNIFSSTIDYIGAGYIGSNDERGIMAAIKHAYNGDYRYANASGCYRPQSSIAYILISDEDERSIGGDQSQVYYSSEADMPLEEDDLPSTFITKIKDYFGANRRFTFNSLIVKPGDHACLSAQDAEGTKSHYGTQYAQLSNQTGGGIGSICESNFATNLNLFKNQIQNSMASVPLECPPAGDMTVTVRPAIPGLTHQLSGMLLSFTPALPFGSTLDISYQCSQ